MERRGKPILRPQKRVRCTCPLPIPNYLASSVGAGVGAVAPVGSTVSVVSSDIFFSLIINSIECRAATVCPKVKFRNKTSGGFPILAEIHSTEFTMELEEGIEPS
jgi:hypothetical protein